MKTKLSEKLQSLPALVLQGFAGGALVFFALAPLAPADRPAPPTGGVAIVAAEA